MSDCLVAEIILCKIKFIFFLYIDRLRPIHTNRKWKQKRIFTLMFETFALVSFHVDFRLV